MKMTNKIGISLIGICALLLLGSPIYAGIWTTTGGTCTVDEASIDLVNIQASLRHHLIEAQGPLEIDDVDATALAEDVALHLRIPPPGLVSEVDAICSPRNSARLVGSPAARRACSRPMRAGSESGSTS